MQCLFPAMSPRVELDIPRVGPLLLKANLRWIKGILSRIGLFSHVPRWQPYGPTPVNAESVIPFMCLFSSYPHKKSHQIIQNILRSLDWHWAMGRTCRAKTHLSTAAPLAASPGCACHSLAAPMHHSFARPFASLWKLCQTPRHRS